MNKFVSGAMLAIFGISALTPVAAYAQTADGVQDAPQVAGATADSSLGQKTRGFSVEEVKGLGAQKALEKAEDSILFFPESGWVKDATPLPAMLILDKKDGAENEHVVNTFGEKIDEWALQVEESRYNPRSSNSSYYLSGAAAYDTYAVLASTDENWDNHGKVFYRDWLASLERSGSDIAEDKVKDMKKAVEDNDRIGFANVYQSYLYEVARRTPAENSASHGPIREAAGLYQRRWSDDFEMAVEMVDKYDSLMSNVRGGVISWVKDVVRGTNDRAEEAERRNAERDGEVEARAKEKRENMQKTIDEVLGSKRVWKDYDVSKVLMSESDKVKVLPQGIRPGAAADPGPVQWASEQYNGGKVSARVVGASVLEE